MTASGAFASARRHLDRNLFPEAPHPPRITARRALICLAIAIAATAVQLLRMWSSLPLESLWAEDGTTWLGGALNGDFLDLLTNLHNGYLQTAQRLIAEPVAALPVEWYPATMAIVGAAVVTGCAFVVWRASAAHIESTYLRAALAAMVILLPVVGTESLANVTNSNWFMLFACFWLLLWRPSRDATAIAAALFLLVVAVTTIGVLLLVPLWLLRAVAIRERRDAVIVIAFALGLAVQLGFSSEALGAGGGDIAEEVPAQFSIQPNWDWELVPAFAQRVVGGAFAGQPVNANLWDLLGPPYGIALALGAVALLVAGLADRRIRAFVAVGLAISLTLFLVSGYRRWGFSGSELFWPEGAANNRGSRYLIAPVLILLSVFFVWLDAAPRRAAGFRGSARGWALIQTGATAFVLLCAVASFSVGAPERGSLPWSEALTAGRAECREGGVEEVMIATGEPPFSGFPVPLPCDKLD